MAVGEWDQRQLCPDGGCVGVIGPDGTCKVCGRAAQNWGDERKRGLLEPEDDAEADDDDDDDEDDDLDDQDADDDLDDDDLDEDDLGDDDGEEDEEGDRAAARTAAAHAAVAPPVVWTSRELCPDGGCIGVIGPDGRCKVCGRPAATSSPATAAAGDAAASVTDEAGDAAGAAPRSAARCSDVACAGAIGADGRCDVCGKVAA